MRMSVRRCHHSSVRTRSAEVPRGDGRRICPVLYVYWMIKQCILAAFNQHSSTALPEVFSKHANLAMRLGPVLRLLLNRIEL